jgi:periplasmic divalent cation tolerance protein
MKTRQELYHALEQLIRHWHSYQTPAIISVPILGGHGAYLKWLDESLAPGE